MEIFLTIYCAILLSIMVGDLMIKRYNSSRNNKSKPNRVPTPTKWDDTMRRLLQQESKRIQPTPPKRKNYICIVACKKTNIAIKAFYTNEKAIQFIKKKREKKPKTKLYWTKVVIK